VSHAHAAQRDWSAVTSRWRQHPRARSQAGPRSGDARGNPLLVRLRGSLRVFVYNRTVFASFCSLFILAQVHEQLNVPLCLGAGAAVLVEFIVYFRFQRPLNRRFLEASWHLLPRNQLAQRTRAGSGITEYLCRKEPSYRWSWTARINGRSGFPANCSSFDFERTAY
jgi:hypothetical protein